MYRINMGAPFGLLTTPVHYNHLVVINYVKEYASLPGTISSQAKAVCPAKLSLPDPLGEVRVPAESN